MKILFTSDLHLTFKSDKLSITSLLYKIKDESPDIIVFGGDIINYFLDWGKFFELYNSIIKDSKTFVVLGNHDLWNLYTRVYDSFGYFDREKIYSYINDICNDNGIIFLEENPQIYENILFCGTVGWYDYSARPEEVNIEYLQMNKRNLMNDAVYIHSVYNDIQYSDLCKKRLISSIRKNYKKVKDVFIFTHVPLFRECVVNAPFGHSQYQWRLSNSFFFNFGLGNSIRRYKKVKFVASGHIHRYNEGYIDNKIKYLTCGSDYDRPKYYIINVDSDIKIEEKS